MPTIEQRSKDLQMPDLANLAAWINRPEWKILEAYLQFRLSECQKALENPESVANRFDNVVRGKIMTFKEVLDLPEVVKALNNK